MSYLRNIPAIDELLEMKQVQAQFDRYNREFLVATLRQATDEVRQALRLSGAGCSREDITAQIVTRFHTMLSGSSRGTLRKVINGTGVVLHTNLGRAPLGPRALQYVQEMASDYNNLEFHLESGERGSRYQHVEQLLVKLTGSEAGLVVNNNAAGVLLGLNTVAQDREVIVSRGQLIEIGGSFRIPDVMRQSGARLVEVGTTNRTYLSDYGQAINEKTALLFSAHTSNYKIVGFSAEVQVAELAALGKAHNIPVMQDLGSGTLSDLSAWGLGEEPTVQASVAAGADLVTFSGDKLLGGPQAGIVVGRANYIGDMKRNQLIRALRVDKMTIAALEGTLLEYWCGDPLQNIPVLRMLTMTPTKLAIRAESLRSALQEMLVDHAALSIRTVETGDMVGGGAYPTYKLPGHGVQITFADNRLQTVARQLRQMEPALVARLQDNALLVSVRTLGPGEDRQVVKLLTEACGQTTEKSPVARHEPCKD